MKAQILMPKKKKEEPIQELTQEQIEKQQDLSPDRLKLFDPLIKSVVVARPKSSLLELMNWTKKTFGGYLFDVGFLSEKVDGLQCFIHNKIIIDGSFLQYAEENKIKIETIYRDSIASWQVDQKSEHFLTQGVFKITVGNCSFLHCALFHKGSQNEDEVSFFIIVEDSNFYKYLNVRNDFDEWLKRRDRMNQEVRVIGGSDYAYDRDITWDDVFLPASLKKSIRDSVEGFLKSEKIYKDNKIPYKRGIIFYGDPGLGKSTLIKIIMANYNFKSVTVAQSAHTNDDTIAEAFEYAQEQAPGLLFIEDLSDLIGQQVRLSAFLNLLDGVRTINGLFVIATTNDINSLTSSITDRPSRFDQKFEIPAPSKEMIKEYLKHWFKDLYSEEEYDKLSIKAKRHKFAYVHLKDLYIRSAYQAIADNRKNPNKQDVQNAMSELVEDKKQVAECFKSEEEQSSRIDIE